VFIGILWIPVIRHLSNQIYQYLQSVQAYISPPIAAVFIMGVFWKRASSKAALLTLITGGILGATRFIIDILYKSGDFNWDILNQIADMSFLNFCIVLFVICISIMFFITLFSREELDERQKVLFLTKTDKESINPVWRIVNISMSILIALTIIGLWVHFA
jgi:SSS family solute:Na+ symporter